MITKEIKEDKESKCPFCGKKIEIPELFKNTQSLDGEERKVLGKIIFAEFGRMKDFPSFVGVQLDFSLQGCGIADGGKYTLNLSKDCKWDSPEERQKAITINIDKLYEILKQAKVNYVSELVGKPVEVTIVKNTFKDFRILSEVL